MISDPLQNIFQIRQKLRKIDHIIRLSIEMSTTFLALL